MWYAEPNAISNAVGYAKFFSRSHHAVIRVYDQTGNVIETHEHAGEWHLYAVAQNTLNPPGLASLFDQSRAYQTSVTLPASVNSA